MTWTLPIPSDVGRVTATFQLSEVDGLRTGQRFFDVEVEGKPVEAVVNLENGVDLAVYGGFGIPQVTVADEDPADVSAIDGVVAVVGVSGGVTQDPA